MSALKWNKQKLLEIEQGYSICEWIREGKPFAVVASEIEGPAVAVSLETGQAETIAEGPGGSMAVLPDPNDDQALVSIMGMYAPFIGQKAGLYHHRRTGDGSWTSKPIWELPFAHRMEFLMTDTGKTLLVVATVSIHKESPQDWAQPGEVFVAEWNSAQGEPSNITKLDLSIFRNHGMGKQRVDGREAVLVSGKEGIFSLVPEQSSRGWRIDQLCDFEVSEFSFLDVDNDGHDELITIEPFHGDRFRVYENGGASWDLAFEDELSFGHGLSCARVGGAAHVVVGSRADDKNLFHFHWADPSNEVPRKQLLEEAAGMTQSLFLKSGRRNAVLSCNVNKSELALYTMES